MSTHAVRAYGPSALGGGARRFFELTVTLARTEFKLRYFGSILGYFWSLMRPLLFFGVIYVVFTKIFSFNKGVPHYGVYLLTRIHDRKVLDEVAHLQILLTAVFQRTERSFTLSGE